MKGQAPAPFSDARGTPVGIDISVIYYTKLAVPWMFAPGIDDQIPSTATPPRLHNLSYALGSAYFVFDGFHHSMKKRWPEWFTTKGLKRPNTGFSL